MELKDLQKMTVKKLREEALNYPKISGVHGMKKAELIDELKKVLGITDEDEAKTKQKIEDTKNELKSKIKSFKGLREKALQAKDKAGLKKARFHIKKLKRELRKNVV